MGNNTFNCLFLSPLEELERKFILSENDLMWELEKEEIETKDKLFEIMKTRNNYKRFVLGRKEE